MSVSRFSEVISYAPNLNIKRREILDRLFSDEETITKLTTERDKAISLMSKSWQHEPHGDELIYNHTKALLDSIERKEDSITKQAERIKELEELAVMIVNLSKITDMPLSISSKGKQLLQKDGE